MPRQTTNTILMIRPKHFGYNHETALSNKFQRAPEENPTSISAKAVTEFDDMVHVLKDHGVHVIVMEDQDDDRITDSVFPNNWVSFNHDGTAYMFPMESEKRRREKRRDIFDQLENDHGFEIDRLIDLSSHEKEGQMLEGTGSMIFDHAHRKVYACLSSRTNKDLLLAHAKERNYEPFVFHAKDQHGDPIYHTNVMMSIGDGFVAICLKSIRDEHEKERLLQSFASDHLEVIDLSLDQINRFAGNLLQLRNKDQQRLIVMSESAYKCLRSDQREQLSKYGRIISSDLNTIEAVGGGSARCMIAEVFLPKKL